MDPKRMALPLEPVSKRRRVLKMPPWSFRMSNFRTLSRKAVPKPLFFGTAFLDLSERPNLDRFFHGRFQSQPGFGTNAIIYLKKGNC
jgi:hypothetical protein